MAQVKKCLFPAAGFGTRFLPITKSLPKEMLPLVNKPLIQYGVEEAFDAGMQQICIVTGRYKEALANYFDVSYEVEQKVKGKVVEENLRSIRLLLEQCSFSYTRQKHIRGLGDAVLAGRTLIGRQAFGLVLADMFFPRQSEINNPLQDLVDLHNRYGCSVIGVVEVAAEERDKYGIAEATADKHGVLRAQRLFEKPQKNQTNSNLAICGRLRTKSGW